MRTSHCSRLRPFDPATDEGHFVRRIELTMKFYGPKHSDFDVELADDHTLSHGATFEIGLTAADRLLYEHGSPAETIDQVLRANVAPMQDGVYRQRVEFDNVRLRPTRNGPPLPIRALTWTETMSHGTDTTIVEAEGEPMLVFEQLDDRGAVHAGRLVVDRDLYAWEIGRDGRVSSRGPLATAGCL